MSILKKNCEQRFKTIQAALTARNTDRGRSTKSHLYEPKKRVLCGYIVLCQKKNALKAGILCEHNLLVYWFFDSYFLILFCVVLLETLLCIHRTEQFKKL